MLKRLSEWLALTTAERNVILFLTGTFLLGLGIRLYQETFPSLPKFDYRKADSTFAALSLAAEQEDSTSNGHQKLDLNTASKAQLMKLPGIGTVTAERILAYREEQGKFKSILDLRNVKGISAKKLEQLKPFVTVKQRE